MFIGGESRTAGAVCGHKSFLWVLLFIASLSPYARALGPVESNPTPLKLETKVALEESATPASCPQTLWTLAKKVANTKVISSDLPRKVWWGSLGALFYPIKAGVQTLNLVARWAQGEPVHKPTRSWWVGNLLQASLFTVLAWASQANSIPVRSLETAVPAQLPTNAVTVTFNGFENGDILKDYTRQRFNMRHGARPNAVYLEPSDDVSALETLRAVAEEHGPIHLLEIYGHGSPGSIVINSGEMTTGRYDSQDSNDTPASHRLIVRRPDESVPPPSNPVLAYQHEPASHLTYVRIKNDYRLQDVLAPNATVIFYGCTTGRGEEGIVFLQYMGEVLSDQGVTLVASEVDVVPNYTDVLFRYYGMNPPNVPHWVHRLTDLASVSVQLSGTIIARLADNDLERWTDFVRLDPIQQIHLPASAPEAQAIASEPLRPGESQLAQY